MWYESQSTVSQLEHIELRQSHWHQNDGLKASDRKVQIKQKDTNKQEKSLEDLAQKKRFILAQKENCIFSNF